MQMTNIIMGMPIAIQLPDSAPASLMGDLFDYFTEVDLRFSMYKADSEMSRFSRGELRESQLSDDLLEVLELARRTEAETSGYFAMRRPDGVLDPTGIVKGWAVRNAAISVHAAGVSDFYVDAGGDIQTSGKSPEGKDWAVGVRNPFNDQEIIKALSISNRGIATSGTYVRGDHIYNPRDPRHAVADLVSLTVIGPDVLEADRFATAAFAMGTEGLMFLEELDGFEAYGVAPDGIATQTSGFGAFVIQ